MSAQDDIDAPRNPAAPVALVVGALLLAGVVLYAPTDWLAPSSSRGSVSGMWCRWPRGWRAR